ncbi:hypothetical protein I6N96_07920 [Enterococcus sp. BWM-S5]|uniref:Uncharacterized protein n=1 Tax=Enterococcus larvae TaxID=2794352 RepID=A0ABS4CJ50_9ENTE|nr:hypothetical protein [Enterococcus larvae]MBP1046208.1 hypothetical protein [Enterococcus larvae]
MNHEKVIGLLIPIFLPMPVVKYFCPISAPVLVGAGHHGGSIDYRSCFLPHCQSQRMEVIT